MDFEKTILDLLNDVSNFDFNVLIRSFLYSLIVIWFFIAIWVWIDSGERSRNLPFRIFSVILVAPFNVVGLIIYLIMRPKETIESIYWGDLERRYLLYETAELGDCPRCGEQLSPGFNVCPNCSFELKVACGSCQMMVDRKWNFCPYCKSKLNSSNFEEEEVSKDTIRQRVEESRQEIREQVEVKGTRYKSSDSMTERLGRAVLSAVMGFGKKVNDTLISLKGTPRTTQQSIHIKADDLSEEQEDAVQAEGEGSVTEATVHEPTAVEGDASEDEAEDSVEESSVAKVVQEEVENALEKIDLPVKDDDVEEESTEDHTEEVSTQNLKPTDENITGKHHVSGKRSHKKKKRKKRSR